MDKKTSGCKYVFNNRHVDVDIFETTEGKQYLTLDGTKSRMVDDIYRYEGEHITFWILIREVEKEILGVVA